MSVFQISPMNTTLPSLPCNRTWDSTIWRRKRAQYRQNYKRQTSHVLSKAGSKRRIQQHEPCPCAEEPANKRYITPATAQIPQCSSQVNIEENLTCEYDTASGDQDGRFRFLHSQDKHSSLATAAGDCDCSKDQKLLLDSTYSAYDPFFCGLRTAILIFWAKFTPSEQLFVAMCRIINSCISDEKQRLPLSIKAFLRQTVGSQVPERHYFCDGPACNCAYVGAQRSLCPVCGKQPPKSAYIVYSPISLFIKRQLENGSLVQYLYAAGVIKQAVLFLTLKTALNFCGTVTMTLAACSWS